MVKSNMLEAVPPHAIHRIQDEASGLDGIVVIHSLRLGPATGGCRFWDYTDICEMAEDAVRLARGMSYKNAMAGLPMGGGKAVINRPKGPYDRQKLFRSFGREIARLGGDYVTAEDVGTNVSDMMQVARATNFVAGLAPKIGTPGGNPSPFTARGVFLAMEVAVAQRIGKPFDRITVAVQGLGNVGVGLCELLHAAGARLIVADLDPERVALAVNRFGAAPHNSEGILTANADILAPCAMGAILNEAVIPDILAKLVCGGANNQLAVPECGALLAERDILYIPDYVANAGGIINVAGEYLNWSQYEVDARIDAIGPRVSALIEAAAQENIPPSAMADIMAHEIIGSAAKRPPGPVMSSKQTDIERRDASLAQGCDAKRATLGWAFK